MKHIIFDCEVFAHDWLVVFKEVGHISDISFHNDNDGLRAYLQNNVDSYFFGFNSKHYDDYIITAILNDFSPEDVKRVNDYIIDGGQGWQCPLLRDVRESFRSADLFDDTQTGLSLKSIEAHLGMNIQETEVDFNLARSLTPFELEQTVLYCRHDVDATERLYELRKDYLINKVTVGEKAGIAPYAALKMTNAKLTAAYLKAEPHEYNDEREYQYPDNLLWEYIPAKVKAFFDRIHDKSISDEDFFSSKLDIKLGDCQCTIGFGGIHGAIPTYQERSTDTRTIRNQDVASFYPHLMTLDGYCSRSIPDPQMYADMLEERIQAKRSGDKAKANALKLVANTTYGGMLNQYNNLYDPLMGRSVCITGQLRLLELAVHLMADCPSLTVIQLNTDGIMISLDNCDIPAYQRIVDEWQSRTGFELEEDVIEAILQKDVNNYIEVKKDSKYKAKGGMLVRGIAEAGAFNINNNAPIIAKAIINSFVYGISAWDTIHACVNPLDFQLIAKASGKYASVYQIVNGEQVTVQRCNRVYASKDSDRGTLFKVHRETGDIEKIAGLPDHCLIDNRNEATMDDIDVEWYVQQAHKRLNMFLGIPEPKPDGRALLKLRREITKMLAAGSAYEATEQITIF